MYSVFTLAHELGHSLHSNFSHKEQEYPGFLKAGSSKYSLDVLKNSGVDLSTTTPIQRGFDKFKEIPDELEKML